MIPNANFDQEDNEIYEKNLPARILPTGAVQDDSSVMLLFRATTNMIM